MGKRLASVLKSSVMAGLFAGIASLIGQNLDPGSMLASLCDLLASLLSGRVDGDVISIIGDLKLAIVIYGLVGTVVLIWSIIYCGRRGILTAACGYYGAVLTVMGLRDGYGEAALGLALLAVGTIVAVYLRDKAGRDLRVVLRAAGIRRASKKWR